jgi:DNA-binding NarL/FixJ family response regulator
MEPVRASVLALDPVLEEGMSSILRLCPRVAATAPGDPAEVVVMTVDRFGYAELDMMRAARDHAAPPAMVLVAGQLGAAEALHALAGGARALLRRREIGAARLTEAVLTAAAGDCTLPSDLFGALVPDASGTSEAQGTTGLNERERAVLRMVAEGYETSEIAERLAYSQRTVTTVLHDITHRFRLRNRAHAVAYALRAGML